MTKKQAEQVEQAPEVVNNIWALDAARALPEVAADAEGVSDAAVVAESNTIEQFMGLDGRTMRVRAKDGALVCQEVKTEGGEA